MIQQAKCLVGLGVALLAIFLPSSALGWSFALSPPEIEIDNLPPGEEAEFNFTIYNKDNVNHVFMLTSYNAEESELRQGKTKLPDNKWVSFPTQVEVQADSKVEVPVKVAIPPEQKWTDKHWEIWLRVAPEEKELLVVNYYIRLLVSTSTEVQAVPNIGLIVGIIIVVMLLSYGLYYYRRKVRYS
jgi:hypothetical protein